MLYTSQRTVRKQIQCTGKGLHSGKDVTLTLLPASVGHGIVFERTDVANGMVKAHYAAVADTQLCSKLSNEHQVSIGTVEHLMAAFAGLGIDNVRVCLDGPEVPIMDGSSEPFIFLIECAGILEQDAPRDYIHITRPVRVESGDAWLELLPSNGFSLELAIDFGHPVVGHQEYAVDFAAAGFKSTLSRARTFGFEEDIARLQQAGLALGGSLDNAIVVGKQAILNQDGLRYQDEFVRHKMLDCIGDLYLAGKPLLARVRGNKMGHALNNKMLHALFSQAEHCWEIVTLDDVRQQALPVMADMPAAVSLAN